MKRSITRILISLGILCMISMIFVGAFAEDTLSISSPGDWELFSWNHAINIKWNSISGAVGYHVSVRNMTTDTLVLNREWVTGTKLDISDYIPASPGKYKVWVGAVEEKGGASPTSWQDYIKIYIAREPDITNGSASTITDDGAVLHMSVDKDYGYEITDCGFYIGTSSTKSQMTKYSFKNYSTSQGATTKGEKSMTVTGLQTGKKYYYRAYAVNEVGEDYSTPGYFTTGGTSNQLDKPVITYPASNATYEASKSIKLQWNAVSDVDGYRYYIKQLSGQPDPTNDDEPCVEEWPGSTSSSRRYYTLSASKVRAGYWYKFVVEAYAEGAKSGWSDWCYVYIGKGALTKPVVTSLTNWSEVNAGSSIVVDWDDVAAAGGYRCHIKQLSGQPDTSDTNEPAVKTWREICGTTSKYTLSAGNVVGGYWYKIVVEAYDGGESTWSDWYYVYAVEGGQLDRPVITSPVAGDNFETGKSISFTWSKVTNAEGYNYFIKELTGEPNYSDNESASRSWTGSTSSTSRRFTLDGDYLQPDTWYKFVVEAKTEGWESGWSRYTYIKIPDRVDWIHYVLPAALTEIPEESFANNSQLRTFDASDSNLISIGSKAFANCTNLLSINLPDTVEFIAEDAFSGCSSVKFHCVSGSYAEEYANRKGISVEKHGIAIESDMIQVSQSTWQPSSAAAQLGIVITSSGNWTASKSSNSSWLTVSSTSGSSGERITFNATKNTKASPRSATVTFMCGDATATVEIEQGKATASWGGGSTTPVVSGSWTDPETIYVTLGDSYQLNGSISVSNGTLGVVSVSVYGGANQALTHNYSAAANNEITTSAINLQYQSDFRINTGFDTSFKEAGTYQLTMYAKADGSNDAVKIGSKTLVVEPVATKTPVVSFTMSSSTVNNSGNGKIYLRVSTTYTDRFYVEVLKGSAAINIYDPYVLTTKKREYSAADFAVGSLYTTTSKTWPEIALTIPNGTAIGNYIVKVTAVNDLNENNPKNATCGIEINDQELPYNPAKPLPTELNGSGASNTCVHKWTIDESSVKHDEKNKCWTFNEVCELCGKIVKKTVPELQLPKCKDNAHDWKVSEASLGHPHTQVYICSKCYEQKVAEPKFLSSCIRCNPNNYNSWTSLDNRERARVAKEYLSIRSSSSFIQKYCLAPQGGKWESDVSAVISNGIGNSPLLLPGETYTWREVYVSPAETRVFARYLKRMQEFISRDALHDWTFGLVGDVCKHFDIDDKRVIFVGMGTGECLEKLVDMKYGDFEISQERLDELNELLCAFVPLGDWQNGVSLLQLMGIDIPVLDKLDALLKWYKFFSTLEYTVKSSDIQGYANRGNGLVIVNRVAIKDRTLEEQLIGKFAPHATPLMTTYREWVKTDPLGSGKMDWYMSNSFDLYGRYSPNR